MESRRFCDVAAQLLAIKEKLEEAHEQEIANIRAELTGKFSPDCVSAPKLSGPMDTKAGPAPPLGEAPPLPPEPMPAPVDEPGSSNGKISAEEAFNASPHCLQQVADPRFAEPEDEQRSESMPVKSISHKLEVVLTPEVVVTSEPSSPRDGKIVWTQSRSEPRSKTCPASAMEALDMGVDPTEVANFSKSTSAAFAEKVSKSFGGGGGASSTTSGKTVHDMNSIIKKKTTWQDAVGLATKVANVAHSFEQKLIANDEVIDAFKIKEQWVVEEDQMLRIKSKQRRASDDSNRFGGLPTCRDASFLGRFGTAFYDVFGDGPEENGKKGRAIHPQSGTRLTWDFATLWLWSYDLVFLPMVVFELPDVLFFNVMDLMGAIYWTLDIGASFITGVYVKGKLVRDLSLVASHYAKTWLPFDVTVVLVDWITILLSSSDYAAFGLARVLRGGRFLRLLRLLRFIRLLRLVKARRIMSDLKARINSSHALLVMGISKLLFIGVTMAHTLACLWYSFGIFSNKGWVYVLGIEDRTLGDRYLWSFMFALSRLHPSTMQANMTLGTVAERVLSILATLLALVFSSIFISSVTTTMAEMKRMRKVRSDQVKVLTEYVRQHRIGPKLFGQARSWMDKESNADNSDLDKNLKKIMPVGLMTELRVEAWSALLTRNPLFGMVRSRHPRTFCALAYEALSEVHLFQGNSVFTTGDACTRMLLCVSGSFIYVLGKDPESCMKLQRQKSGGHHRPSVFSEEHYIEPGMWLSEASLYTVWQHCGDLFAHTESQLLAVDANELATVVKQYEQAFVDVVIYARVFIAELNKCGGHFSDLPQATNASEMEGEYELDSPRPPSLPRKMSKSLPTFDNLRNIRNVMTWSGSQGSR